MRPSLVKFAAAAGLAIQPLRIAPEPEIQLIAQIARPVAHLAPVMASASAASAVVAPEVPASEPVSDLEKRKAEMLEDAKLYYQKSVDEPILYRKLDLLRHVFLRIRNDPRQAYHFKISPEQLVHEIRTVARDSFEYERTREIPADPIEAHLRVARMRTALYYIGTQMDGVNDETEVTILTGTNPDTMAAEVTLTGSYAAGPALVEVLEARKEEFMAMGPARLNRLLTLTNLIGNHVHDAIPYGGGLNAEQIYEVSGAYAEAVNTEIGKRNAAERLKAIVTSPEPKP